MAFKFRIQKGLHVEQSLFDKLCEARNLKLHGEIRDIEAVRVAADSPDDLQSKVRDAKIARVTQAGITVVEHGAQETERFPFGDFFIITTEKGCMRIKGYGDDPSHVGLVNFLNAEIQAEPERRKTYKEQAEKSKPTPRAERFAKADSMKGARI